MNRQCLCCVYVKGLGEEEEGKWKEAQDVFQGV